MTLPVYDNGRPHKAFMFGGPEPRDGVEGGRKFLASPNGASFERMVKLQTRKPGEPNPFVDPASWQQWLVRLKSVADKYIADETAKTSSPTR